jgi:Uma2 family endonuclease
MAVARQGLTLAAFLQLPEEKPALEYFEGAVTQRVAPGPRPSALQVEAGVYLDERLRPRRLGRVFTELRTTFGGTSLVPDVAVYRWDRVPRTAGGELASDAVTPPDLVVEILSPGQSPTELVAKCQWFIQHGVRVALLLDPRDTTIRVFRPGTSPSTHQGTERIDLAEIAPDLEMVPSAIFAALVAD